MISIQHINGEIAALEAEKPTFAVMARLADLYTVRDHIIIGDERRTAEQTAHIDSQTEFARTIEGLPLDTVWAVVDELMATLQAVDPRLYAAVLRKIKGE